MTPLSVSFRQACIGVPDDLEQLWRWIDEFRIS